MNSPNFSQFIWQLGTIPDRNHMVPDRLGSAAHKILKVQGRIRFSENWARTISLGENSETYAFMSHSIKWVRIRLCNLKCTKTAISKRKEVITCQFAKMLCTKTMFAKEIKHVLLNSSKHFPAPKMSLPRTHVNTYKSVTLIWQPLYFK